MTYEINLFIYQCRRGGSETLPYKIRILRHERTVHRNSMSLELDQMEHLLTRLSYHKQCLLLYLGFA